MGRKTVSMILSSTMTPKFRPIFGRLRWQCTAVQPVDRPSRWRAVLSCTLVVALYMLSEHQGPGHLGGLGGLAPSPCAPGLNHCLTQVRQYGQSMLIELKPSVSR